MNKLLTFDDVVSVSWVTEINPCETISVDVDYFKHALMNLGLDKIKIEGSTIQVYDNKILQTIKIKHNLLGLYSEESFREFYNVCDVLSIPLEEFIKINQLVLEKEIPLSNAKEIKPLKF